MKRAVLGIMMGLGFTACTQTGPFGPTEQPEVPSFFEVVEFKGPLSKSAPDVVLRRINQIQLLQSKGHEWFKSSAKHDPENHENGSAWRYDKDDLTITIIATEPDPGYTRWRVRVEGNDGYTEYANWTALKGNTLKEEPESVEMHRNWVLYLPNTVQRAMLFDATRDRQETVTIQIIDYLARRRITGQNNRDGSGYVLEFIEGEKVFEAQWSAAGAGNWSVWGRNGQQADGGIWK